MQSDHPQFSQLIEKAENTLNPLTKYSKCVMFIGQSKSGVSTSYNWVAGYSLKKSNQGHSDYVYVSKDSQAAQTKNNLERVTLIPNIKEKQNTYLVDMPTVLNQQKEQMIRSVVSGYIFEILLRNCQEFKIVLVINQSITNNKTQWLKTFSPFLQMFQVAEMSQEYRKKFISCVSLIVNKSNNQKKYLNNCTKMLQHFENSIQNQNKLVYDFVNDIKTWERLIFLPQASQDSQNPQNCKIFEQQNWNYFNHKEGYQSIQGEKKALINIKLDGNQAKTLQNILKYKMQYFEKAAKIIPSFIKNVKQKWKTGVYSYKQTFQEIAQLLKNYDHYKEINRIQKIQMTFKYSDVEKNFEILNQMQQLNYILEIYNYSSQICQKSLDQDQKSYLKKIECFCISIFSLMKNAFCSNRQQQELFINFSFVMKCHFELFGTISKILSAEYIDSHAKILTQLQKMFQLPLSDIKKTFVFDMPQQKKLNLLKDSQIGNKYCQFLLNYQQQNADDNIKLCQEIIKVTEIIADIYIQDQQYSKGFSRYLQCFKNYQKLFCPYYQQLSSQVSQEYILEEKKAALNLQIILILCKIATSLEKMNRQYWPYSLAIYHYLNYVDFACNLYEKMIENQQNIKLKQTTLLQYGRYCFDSGRFQQGMIKLQIAMSIQKKDANKLDRIRKQMIEAMNQKSRHENQYRQKLFEWHFIDFENPDLRQIFQKVKQIQADL